MDFICSLAAKYFSIGKYFCPLPKRRLKKYFSAAAGLSCLRLRSCISSATFSRCSCETAFVGVAALLSLALERCLAFGTAACWFATFAPWPKARTVVNNRINRRNALATRRGESQDINIPFEGRNLRSPEGET